jgi:hypothetical protein
MSSIPVLDRADSSYDDDDWTDVRSPRLPRYSPEDVRYAIAAARARYRRGDVDSIEVDFEEQRYGGTDPDLAADIQESVGQFWDQ